MEKATRKVIEDATEIMTISFQKALQMTGDPETAVNIAARLCLLFIEAREVAPTAPAAPSVDDVIAGLKEAMEKEHGKEGTT